jgi:hypothetical protein
VPLLDGAHLQLVLNVAHLKSSACLWLIIDLNRLPRLVRVSKRIDRDLLRLCDFVLLV